ncbi:MAG TPA: hypothetical protein VFB05_30985, partial [Bradyrhizobium sp.]|nr:hypothetical protein [Bradyrhizobium sp.]
DSGQWKPAKTAVNPQTREMVAFDGKDWQKVTTHGHGVLGYIDDAVRALASGMTFGYADELAAKMGELTGVGGKKGDYEGNLAQQRARDKEIPAAISVPGEIAGSVASTMAAAPATAAAGAVTGLSKLPTVAKAISSGAGVGALFGSGQSEGGLEDRLKGAAEGGAIGAATGGVLSLAGKIFGAAGDKIMTSVIRPTSRDIADGFSLDTIKRFDLGGSLNTTYEKTQSKLGELSTQLREKLASSRETINLEDIVDQTRKELNSSGKLKGFGANQKIASALDSLGEEVNLVGNNLSIPDAQIVKQASGSFGAWQFGRPDPESKASEIVYNVFYNKLKTAIEKASPEGVKEINQDISKLIPVSNALIRRMPVASRNNMVSLTDMVSLAASLADPRAMGLSALSFIQKSGAAGNSLSKLGAKIPSATVPATVGNTLGASAFQQ